LPFSVCMETLDRSGALLEQAGFRRVRVRDRSAWYRDEARRELDDLLGPLRERAIEAIGDDDYRHWVEVRRAICSALESGCLRPGHLFGRKPKAAP